MRTFPLLFSLACLCGASVAHAQTQAPKTPATTEPVAEKDGLRVSIAPTSNGGNNKVIVLRSGDPHINIVLQNTSTKPLNIFEEWNSWGAYNLTLKITKIDGKVFNPPLIVAKGAMAWDENAPSVEILAPGQVIVREVRLHIPNPIPEPKVPTIISGMGMDMYVSGPLYGGFPAPKQDSTRRITMSAVFANDDADGALAMQKKMAWTGSIASAPTDYRIYWGAR